MKRHKQRLIDNPSYMLLQFRDRHASDFRSLCKRLGFEGEPYSAGYYIEQHLRRLVDAGLLSASHPDNLYESTFTPTKLVREVQTALAFSLADHAARTPSSIQVDPFFGHPKQTSPVDVFVIMPFRVELEPVYVDHIRDVCIKLGLTVARGDDMFGVNSVVADIWAAAYACRAVIADCTQRNPNVFYELGMVHTLGKPTVLITQSEDDVPFDLRYVRYIRYEMTPRGMKAFEKTLRRTLTEALSLEEA
jgi:hypothetical protein